MEAFSQNDSPQAVEAIIQSDPNPSGFNSQTSIQAMFLLKGQID
jgi:hypothetical protein